MSSRKKEKSKNEGPQKTEKGDLKELQESLESVQKEKDELFEKLQRISADYANYQKRAPKQIADTVGYEKERIIKSLLPVLDNFEHTLQNAHSAEDVEVLLKGVQIIYDQLIDVLKSHNVEQIEAKGEAFNPAMHEAMTRRSEPDVEDNAVLEEFQKGYKLNDRVIRPSKVIVNKIVEEQKELQDEVEAAEEPVEECQETDECEAEDRE